MSWFNKYNNEFDPEDDGGDIQITAAEEAGSDDRGRQEAAVCISTAASIRGTKKPYEDLRRMWFRTAKKTLAEGRERRMKAAADEKAVRVAAAKAAANKADNEERAKRSRESIGQFCVEFDERWTRINDETRVANEAWAAGKEERDAAERARRPRCDRCRCRWRRSARARCDRNRDRPARRRRTRPGMLRRPRCRPRSRRRRPRRIA